MIEVSPSPPSTSETRFAFAGAVGDLLRDCLQDDMRQAQLPAKFQLYYRLRRFIPTTLRHRLQRQRNQRIDVPADWYLPGRFLADLQAAIAKDDGAAAIHPWPDGFDMSVVLTHDVETERGQAFIDQLAAVEEQYGFRSAWNIVPYDYKVDMGLIAELRSRGHEIGVHGFNHDGRLFESRETFAQRSGPINRAMADFGSLGFRAPMVHRNLRWINELEIDYDSSCFDVDPFQAMPGGVGGVWPFIYGKFVELPYTLPQDHTLLVTLGETSPQIWIDKLACVRSLAGMALLITHPDYLDSPARLAIYREFLEHLAEAKNVWHALPVEVAKWWRQRDALNMVDSGASTTVIGPEAERARVFPLNDLQLSRRAKHDDRS